MDEELVCVRCVSPIPKNAFYTEDKNGKPVHWHHTSGAIGDMIDTGAPIGFGKDPDPAEKKES